MKLKLRKLTETVNLKNTRASLGIENEMTVNMY